MVKIVKANGTVERKDSTLYPAMNKVKAKDIERRLKALKEAGIT